MKAFLRLDPKYKVFQKLGKQSHEIEAEITAFKQRISRQEDKGESVPQEIRVQVRAADQRAKMPYRPGMVDF